MSVSFVFEKYRYRLKRCFFLPGTVGDTVKELQLTVTSNVGNTVFAAPGSRDCRQYNAVGAACLLQNMLFVLEGTWHPNP